MAAKIVVGDDEFDMDMRVTQKSPRRVGAIETGISVTCDSKQTLLAQR